MWAEMDVPVEPRRSSACGRAWRWRPEMVAYMLSPMSFDNLPNELDVLRDVADRLDHAGIPFMLTGSLAMSFYAMPRMTRDIDLVVQIARPDIARLVSLFENDYYVAREAIEEAVRHGSAFNLIHRASVVKVDFFPRKTDEYHLTEFARRRQVSLGDFSIWIASREDLILSKLLWARESRSEQQLRDARNLLGEDLDEPYVNGWAASLEIDDLWRELSR